MRNPGSVRMEENPTWIVGASYFHVDRRFLFLVEGTLGACGPLPQSFQRLPRFSAFSENPLCQSRSNSPQKSGYSVKFGSIERLIHSTATKRSLLGSDKHGSPSSS